MAFTFKYAADPDDRNAQANYEKKLSDVYDDWLTNKEIHLVNRPTMGVDYKPVRKPTIVEFITSLPEYIKITFCVDRKKIQVKRTQVWQNKQRVPGKSTLCLYRINCIIMKVEHFNKPSFVLSKPKEGVKQKVLVVPMTGGKDNRKSLSGILDLDRVVDEEKLTDLTDQEVICHFFGNN